MSSSKKLQLPVSKVKTIMKSSPDVEQVGQEPLILVTKVTELFIADLAKRAHAQNNLSVLDYKQIANLVQDDDTLDFLREILPCKITVRQFREIMAKKSLNKSESDSEENNTSVEDTDDKSDIDDVISID